MDNLTFIGSMIGAAIFLIGIIGLTIAKLYERASKELAFVRTGMGGQKVVKDGGAVVLPVFHETIPINMQTLRLTVSRGGADGSLITKDRLRVDVKAEFYVRVSPDEASIATAAQTLGRRTLQPAELSSLIEGKFIDALRAAAATMDMQDLHEKRADFVQKVQSTVAEDLKKNGLELESVSLTGLDQTDVKFFNPNNAFDAEGLAKLTQVTETRKKERNEIEADNRVAIETKNLQANSKSLELAQAQEFARLEQEREVETRRAEQEAQLATERAERTREADMAVIAAVQATEQARVQKDQAIKISEVEAAQALELANQNQRIAVAVRSEEESTARAQADKARGIAVEAAEAVKTVEATAMAERAQKVAVIAAETEAQKDATRIRVMADAELQAADSQAQAKERLIQAEAKRYEVEAEGQLALNNAANSMSAEQAALLVRQKFIAALPEILEAMGKPIEKIDSFRVVNMHGSLGGNNAGAIEGETGQSGSFANDLTTSLLKYRMQIPAVDAMAAELGIDLSQGMNGLVDAASTQLAGTGTIGVTGPARIPVPSSRRSRVVESSLPADEKAEIQKLAGINTDDV